MPDSKALLGHGLLSPPRPGGQTPDPLRPGFVARQRVYREPSGPHADRLSGAKTGLRTQGFDRLAATLKGSFPQLRLCLNFDSLYGCGRVFCALPEVSLALRGHLQRGPHARTLAGVSSPLETEPPTKLATTLPNKPVAFTAGWSSCRISTSQNVPGPWGPSSARKPLPRAKQLPLPG